MCGRYTLTKAQIKQNRYNLANDHFHVDRPNYNVAPGQFMPIITHGEDGKNNIELMKWGLVPFWAKDMKIGYKLINARAETLFEKPMWRSVIKSKRCLIPATGFYEWKKVLEGTKERKQPFYIRPKHEELFSFAGVWDTWKDVEGKEWKTYSIITTEPNREMKSVHKRMPVILHQEDEASWLEPSHETRETIEPFLHPYEDNGLELFEVSTDVNATRNNDEHLVYPIGAH